MQKYIGVGHWCQEHRALNISSTGPLGYVSVTKLMIDNNEYFSPIHYLLYSGFMHAGAMEYAFLAAQATNHQTLANILAQFKQRRLESADVLKIQSLQSLDQLKELYAFLADKYNIRHLRQYSILEKVVKTLFASNDFPPMHSIEIVMHDKVDPLELNSSENFLATCCNMLKMRSSPWTKALKRVAKQRP